MMGVVHKHECSGKAVKQRTRDRVGISMRRLNLMSEPNYKYAASNEIGTQSKSKTMRVMI